jgi:hypothetical protein
MYVVSKPIVYTGKTKSSHAGSYGRTNSLPRKSSTSAVVDGPPMFRKTIAVGPFEPAASCVTGGTAVAIPYLWLPPKARQLRGTGRMAEVAALAHTRREIAKGLRNDMAE